MKANADAILRPEQAAYLDALEPARDALLVEMEAMAAGRYLPISDPEVASFLFVTARARDPRFVVELGTNIGYGAVVLARAATNARVVTIEYAHEHVVTARGFLERAGLAGRVEVREGKALEELAKIREPIDLAYVDCVKEEYPEYLELLLPRLAPRAVIVADNVLWRGLCAVKDVPLSEKVRVDALRRFNERVTRSSGLRGVVLPLGDGVAYAVKV